MNVTKSDLTKKLVGISLVRDGHTYETIDDLTCEEAKAQLRARNASTANRFRWIISPGCFVDEHGVDLSVDEANAIRRACGVAEW